MGPVDLLQSPIGRATLSSGTMPHEVRRPLPRVHGARHGPSTGDRSGLSPIQVCRKS
jgi:hypothetical protein